MTDGGRIKDQNVFTQLILFCNGEKFGNELLDFDLIDKDILFCYLNIAMTSTANIIFKEK